ncbi:MAG: hypothetical protein R6U54_03500 [Candidatus Omnitrophota bacterium]
MSKRLDEIYRKNAEFKKKSPYNFCDRWCQRCPHEKQNCCRLYLDDFERRATCIAHGREEDDSEITEAVFEGQYKDMEEKLGEQAGKFDIDLDNPEIDESELDEGGWIDFEDLPKGVQEHIKFVENNPLDTTANNYSKKARIFLKDTFYKSQPADSKFRYAFETISWYHTLLPVKLKRALAGFHEPVSEDEFALYDAVAQFEICKKSAQESIKALREIKKHFPSRQAQIIELIALLHNIYSRIEALLKTV